MPNTSHMFYEQPSPLEQKLLHKVLDYKFKSSGSAALDYVLNDPANQEAIKGKFKNVCALISEPLTNRLEETLSVLSMSKREFLEVAIIEALDKIDSIINEVDAFEFDRAIQEQHTKEGV
jgi:hypothetical protein